MTHALRILMINHEFTVTGASQIFFRLVRHLQDQGHLVSLLPCNPAEGPMKPRYEQSGVEILTRVDPANFDLAVANTVASAGHVLQLGPHLPTIWYIHEAEIGLALLLHQPAWVAAFRTAAAVVYNMPFQHEVFRSFTYALDPGKFQAIPFGVEIDLDSIARAAIPAKTRRFRVVQLGTLEPRKRPSDVIRAVARSGLDIECVLCGLLFHLDDDARALVERQPDRYRIVQNATDGEVLAWLESADIVCLASASETQGLAAYEAALLARPLLLTDLPCYRDVFVHGRHCLMAPVGHVDMLALSMVMLAANPDFGRRLGVAAQSVARRYSRAAFFARFDGVVVSVLNRLA